MNPGGPKSGTDTLHSVTDIVKAGTNELLEALKNTPFGNRRQTVLKALVRCVTTQEQPPGSPIPHRPLSVTEMPAY